MSNTKLNIDNNFYLPNKIINEENNNVLINSNIVDIKKPNMHKNEVNIRPIQDFTVFFQAQYCIAQNKYVGAESLARLKGSNHNGFPFNEIKKIENSPLFNDFGIHIIYESLSKTLPIIEKNKDFKVSINISPTQLEDDEFLLNFHMIVNNLKFPYRNICLEIVESTELICTDKVLSVINGLRSKGVSLAVDDFGTGFSSMSLISEIDFDIIKIDKMFIDKIENEEKARSLLSGLVSVCESVNATIVVEGIENPYQLGILNTIKSNLILQGYFCAKPMPIENLELLIK